MGAAAQLYTIAAAGPVAAQAAQAAFVHL